MRPRHVYCGNGVWPVSHSNDTVPYADYTLVVEQRDEWQRRCEIAEARLRNLGLSVPAVIEADGKAVRP